MQAGLRRGPLPARPFARPRIVGKSEKHHHGGVRERPLSFISEPQLDLSSVDARCALRSSMSSMPQQRSATRDDYVRILRSEELLSRSVREALANLLLSTSVAAPMAAARNVTQAGSGRHHHP